MIVSVATLAFVGAIVFYIIRVEVPKHRESTQQAYRESTKRLTERLSTGVANLSEWSTDASLESYSKAIRILAERHDADAALNDQLNERVDSLKEARRKRQIRFESLLGEVDAFPLVSPVDDVLAFDRRMRKATLTLSLNQGQNLMGHWSDRRDNVVAIREANQ